MSNRTITIKALLTESENKTFVKNITISGLSKSRYIRKAILGQKIKARLPEEYAEVQRLLANVSNNINQIAHITNATGNIHYAQIETLTRLVDKMYDHIMSLG